MLYHKVIFWNFHMRSSDKDYVTDIDFLLFRARAKLYGVWPVSRKIVLLTYFGENIRNKDLCSYAHFCLILDLVHMQFYNIHSSG